MRMAVLQAAAAEDLPEATGAALKCRVQLPGDMRPGLAYLEVHQGAFVGAACPVLILPREQRAASAELLQALIFKEAMLMAALPMTGELYADCVKCKK